MTEILQFFEYGHLRDDLKAASRPFGEMAREIVERYPANEQRAVALQRLLEAKDALVRCVVTRQGEGDAAPL